MIVFECASCNKKLQVADEHAGKTITCPGCKAKATVPAQPQAAPPSDAVEPDYPPAINSDKSRRAKQDIDAEEPEGDEPGDRPTRRKPSSKGPRPTTKESGAGKMLLYIGGGIAAFVMLVVGGVFCRPCLLGMFFSLGAIKPGQNQPLNPVKKAGQEPPAELVKKLDPQPQPKVFRYVNDDLKVEIVFPRQFQEVAIDGGKTWLCPLEKPNSFMFYYIKLKQPIDINNKAQVKLILDGGRKGGVGVKGKLMEEKDFIMQKAYPARDIEIQNPGETYRVWMVLTPTHFLQIAANGTKEFTDSTEAKQFRASFKFLEDVPN